MPHPELNNQTPYAYDSLVLSDEEAAPQFVMLLQATFAVGTTGEVVLLEEQPQPNLAGEWYGDPATSSMKREPQIAFIKPATDVVLLGHAWAPARGATQSRVGIRVGPMSKLARVLGDRTLLKRAGAIGVSDPLPFEKIPLCYERAFGGWDRRSDDPQRQRCEIRNPVGVGFRDAALDTDDELRLPNIEADDQPMRGYGDTPPPTGFGFLAPNWQPRLAFGGTYDAAWNEQRKPLLPSDFDRRFFNAASPGLIAPGYLVGNEQVVIIGASPNGRIDFDLPGVPPPQFVVGLRGRKRVAQPGLLDTVIVDTDVSRLTLLWRAHIAVRNGAHDVLAVEVRAPANDS